MSSEQCLIISFRPLLNALTFQIPEITIRLDRQMMIQKRGKYMMKKNIRYFCLLTFSTLIMAFGTYFFKFTNNFTFGGITGLAVLVARTGLVSAGDFNLVA